MTGELTAVTAQSIVANAQQLGLTWTMRVATVENGDNPKIVRATCDGDSESIIMQSTIGRIRPGARVFCVSVPPSLNYVIGYAETLTNETRHTRVIGARASGDLALGTSPVVVPGTSVDVVTYFPDAVASITMVVDVDVNAFTVSNVAIGELYVNGVAQDGQALMAAQTINDRETHAQTYVVSFDSAGTYTIEIRGSKTSASNTIEFNSLHTAWSGVLVDGP